MGICLECLLLSSILQSIILKFSLLLGAMPMAFSFFASFLIFFFESLIFFWIEYFFLRVVLFDVVFLIFGILIFDNISNY